MIHVLATIELQPGKRDAFLAEFHQVMPAVKAEVGCIEYGPATDAATDLPQQQRLGENAVLVVEKWASLEALKAHLVAPHMLAYRERVKGLVVGSRLQILQPA
ncbi:MAG: putative quinol monooxygenase [Planctomycetaceae bacterium]